MSYCRRGDDSDVYVYPAGEPCVIICCACSLTNDDYVTHGAMQMIQHLSAHQLAGHKVPFEALGRLWRETNGKE